MMKTEQKQSDSTRIENFTRSAHSECRTVSVEDAARILGVSRGTAYTLAGEKKLPTIRLGKRLLVPKDALERLLAGA